MTKESRARRRRAIPRAGEKSGQFIRRMLVSGQFEPDEMAKINKRYFPELKTNRKSVYYYWYHLRDKVPDLMPWPSQRAHGQQQAGD